MNPAATRMFGYSLYDLLGQNIGMLSPERSRLIRLADCAQKLDQGIGAAVHETEGRRKDGVLFPLECTISESAYRDQRLFIIVARDLTERLQIEARMQKLRADRLDAMGGMATALSHEINQPLGAAAIYLSAAHRLLGRSLFKPSGVENALAKAADQVTRAGQIVGRMRSFVTRGEPDATPQSMYELAREAHELASGAGLSDVEVSFRLNARNDRVLADKIQIQQVLVNLIKNAMQAMTKGGTLTLQTGERSDEAWLSVSDNGGGIPPEQISRIFEPFYTTKKKGTGLGLMIVQRIVRAHDGRIDLESHVGRGTTFRVWLPLHERKPRLLEAPLHD